jgi:hypothetical protein
MLLPMWVARDSNSQYRCSTVLVDISCFRTYHKKNVGRDSAVDIANALWTGRFGDGIPAMVRFSAPVQTVPGPQPASYIIGTGSFPGVKRPGCGADHTHTHIAPRLNRE